VFDPERDVAKVRKGEGSDLIYAGITGVVEANQRSDRTEVWGDTSRTPAQKIGDHAINEDEGSASESDDNDENNTDKSEGIGEKSEKQPRGHRHEDKDAKKERKKVVKEEARERRKTKLPKAEKKRRIRQTSSK